MTLDIDFRTVLLCFNAAERPLVLLLGGGERGVCMKKPDTGACHGFTVLNWMNFSKLGDFYGQCELQEPEVVK